MRRGCGRLEWSCLDWNQPSIDFYKSPGAPIALRAVESRGAPIVLVAVEALAGAEGACAAADGGMGFVREIFLER